jgi:hypothetical protein
MSSMNERGGDKGYVNKVKFRCAIIREFRALAEELWEAVFSTPWIHLVLAPDSGRNCFLHTRLV